MAFALSVLIYLLNLFWYQWSDYFQSYAGSTHDYPHRSSMLTSSSGFTRYWDPVASVPYLYNAQTHIFVTYDDPQSIAVKCQYVLSHRLGGVMFWDYSGDPTGALLRAIDQSFHQPEAKGSSLP